MFDWIEEKLGIIVDFFTNQWAKWTNGKRGEDDLSGLFWIVGAILLLVDLFAKSVGLLIFALVLIGYGLFRCFSPFSYHEKENELFAGLTSGCKALFVKLWEKLSGKMKDFKEADKKAYVEQLKNKVVPDDETKQEKEQEREMKKKYSVFECPGCKQQVRIPNRGKKGRVAIVCPACKTRFVRMRW